MPGTGLPIQGAFTWLRLTKETSYGVFDPAGAHAYIVMTGDDVFSAQVTKLVTQIRSADTSNRRRNQIASKYTIAGGFQTPFYPSQAQLLLDISSTLSTTIPHTLPSMTADFFDGQTVRRYLGGVVESTTINADAATQYANLQMNWRFSKVDDAALTLATFPPPTCSDLPQEDPFLFNELAGQVVYDLTGVGPTTLVPVTVFDSLNVTIANILESKHYENPWVAYTLWCGRDVGFSTNLAYLDTTWRDAYEQQQMLTFKATFFRSSAQQATLDFHTKNYLSARPVRHPLAGVVTQSLNSGSFYDCSVTPTPTDFSFSALYS